VTGSRLARVMDASGAGWPVTGTVCHLCGWPTVDEDTHVPCALDPAAAARFRRSCQDCGQPLPVTAGVGVRCHTACWMDRKRPGVVA
jgi:predicted amidophosphoribosyltransferase